MNTGDVAYVKVRIDTKPDKDSWCFCTPYNHPDDVATGKVDEECDSSSQLFGQVFKIQETST